MMSSRHLWCNLYLFTFSCVSNLILITFLQTYTQVHINRFVVDRSNYFGKYLMAFNFNISLGLKLRSSQAVKNSSDRSPTRLSSVTNVQIQLETVSKTITRRLEPGSTPFFCFQLALSTAQRLDFCTNFQISNYFLTFDGRKYLVVKTNLPTKQRFLGFYHSVGLFCLHKLKGLWCCINFASLHAINIFGNFLKC